MKELFFDVKDLSVLFILGGRMIDVVKKVLFYIYKGEILVLVGEFGFGKLVSVFFVFCLLLYLVVSYLFGKIMFDGEDLMEVNEK